MGRYLHNDIGRHCHLSYFSSRPMSPDSRTILCWEKMCFYADKQYLRGVTPSEDIKTHDCECHAVQAQPVFDIYGVSIFESTSQRTSPRSLSQAKWKLLIDTNQHEYRFSPHEQLHSNHVSATWTPTPNHFNPQKRPSTISTPQNILTYHPTRSRFFVPRSAIELPPWTLEVYSCTKIVSGPRRCLVLYLTFWRYVIQSSRT